MDKQKIKNLIAVIFVVIIPFMIMIWYRMQQKSDFVTEDMIRYPILFGGGSILIILLAKKYFLRENLIDFNKGKGSILKDIIYGILLSLVYFILFFIERQTLSDILNFRSNTEFVGLMLDMRERPLLILLWFLPVLWIGIALYEEMVRIFLLTALWKFSSSKTWTIIIILLTSILIGLTHWSQGSYGIVTIGIKSVVACLFFYKYERLLPLVIAHALYDGIQVALFLITYP